MKNTLLLLFVLTAFITGTAQNTYTFNFGNKTDTDNTINIETPLIYTDDIGYGFDYNSQPTFVKNKNGKPEQGYCTANEPFYFSVKIPEGDYKVTVKFGDAKGTSKTTIKTENRRLMVESLVTEKGEIKTESFIVNVRTPKINDSTTIRLKSREHKYLNWDNKLTLEFSDAQPKICALEITPVKAKATIYLAGNSTVTDQYAEPWASWGQMVTAFVKPDVSVANYAESGESLHSFYHAKRLEKILTLIQPGDYLFIEFAHNDQKRKGEGIGPWQSYSDYLRHYIDEARKKGATPVLITSMHRRNFNEQGEVYNTLGDYPDAMRAIAKEKGVLLIDLNNMSKTLYEAWGPENSKKGFVHYPAHTYPGQAKAWADNTHFNNYGAYHIALCIIYGIMQQDTNLKELFKSNLPAVTPSTPIPFNEWTLPESKNASNETPEGS